MKKSRHNNNGLTLVELLVACALVTIILSAVSGVMLTGIKTYNTNLTNTVNQQSLRSAMITITKQVRNAPAGTVTITGTKVLTVQSQNYSVSNNNLVRGSSVLATNIASIYADYTDTTHAVVQVDLAGVDGTRLSTQIRVN